jgi:hypothetical protein
MDSRTYEVEYNGVSNEIDEHISEQKEFKDKALKIITKEQFEEILVNSWDGLGFFGIIISGSDIIKAIKDGSIVVGSSEMIIGIHDGFNGSGYFKRANVAYIPNAGGDCDNKEYEIVLARSELDWGRYSLGAVFGGVEWRYE